MAFPSQFKNIACQSATKADAVTSAGALDRIKSCRVTLQREVIFGRSDHSLYPTVLDTVHNGYRWEILCRDIATAETWVQEQYLNQATFYLYQAGGSGYMQLQLEGIAVDTFEVVEAWGQLVGWRLGGFATRCKVAESTESLSAVTALESGLTVRALTDAPNFPDEGDTINQWDSTGLS